MTLRDLSAVILTTLCIAAWIVFLWRVGQVVAQPDRRGTRLLAIFVGLVALELTFSVVGADDAGRVLDPVLRSPYSSVLAINLLLVAAYATLISFLWYIASRDRRSQLYFQHLPACVAVVVLLTAWYRSSPDERGARYNTLELPLPMATFWVAASLYLGFASLLIGYLVWNSVAESDPLTRRCYRISAVGMFGVVVGIGVARALAGVLSALGIRLFPQFGAATEVVVRISVVLIVVGLVIPAVMSRTTALRLLIRHYRLEVRMRPLWSDLDRLFPEHSLSPSLRPPAGVTWRPRRVHERFYRRLVECRDGLLAISALAATRMPAHHESPDREASALVLALDEGRDAAKATPGPGPVLATPAGPNADDDARALAALSQRLTEIRAHPPRSDQTASTPHQPSEAQ